MTTFLLDLWQDLREKRLWPVAVGLLAAAFAIPAIMLKPASEAPQGTTVVTNSGERETLPAVNVDTAPTHDSKLDTFSARNPFKPLADLKKEGASPSPSGSAKGAGNSGTGASGGSSPSLGGSGLGGSSGSGLGGSSGSGSGSGGSGGGAPSGIDPNGPSVQYFRYTADLSFGTPDKMETMKSVNTLTPLPNETTASIIFMGVSDDAKSAMFMIADPAFIAAGEGECNDDQNCRFVKLGIDEGSNEESFTSQDGNTEYDVKLLKLNRENITAEQAKGDATDQQPAGKKAKGVGGNTIKQASADFLPQLLAPALIARKTK
jgi:hypothetical protein